MSRLEERRRQPHGSCTTRGRQQIHDYLFKGICNFAGKRILRCVETFGRLAELAIKDN